MKSTKQDVTDENKIIQEDFKVARKLFRRIEKEFPTVQRIFAPHILFAMCLIYARQLKHHKKEEREIH